MLKIGHFLKFISERNPQVNPARLAYYNFLKTHYSIDDEFTAEHQLHFINSSLDYPHWNIHKASLGQELKLVLEQFNNALQNQLSLSQFKYPQNFQVIEIERMEDLQALCFEYLKSKYSESCKVKTLSDSTKRVIALVLCEDKSIDVYSFDKKCVIRNGRIEPLRLDLKLQYNSNLELKENVLQVVELAPYVSARFKIENGFVSGQLIRGYVYQLYSEIKKERLGDIQKLSLPIKRIEQFFVDRKSDLYYQNLLNQLERGSQLLREKDQNALTISSAVINQAEIASEHVYCGDKLLELLIRDLKHLRSDLGPKVQAQYAYNSRTELPPLIEDREVCPQIIPVQKLDSIN